MALPTLFFPGTLCDERVWLPVWQQLNLSQRRYVPLQWAGSFEDMISLTNDRVLPDEKVHLVGFSMGGYVATQWALNHSNNVASLTLIGYAPQGLTQREEKKRKVLLQTLSKANFNPHSDSFIAPYVLDGNIVDEQIGKVVAQMAEDLGPTTLKAHIASTTPRKNLLNSLAKVRFPIHFIGSSSDAIAPLSSVKEAHSQMNNARLTVIENAAHMMTLENPSAVTAALSALK